MEVRKEGKGVYMKVMEGEKDRQADCKQEEIRPWQVWQESA